MNALRIIAVCGVAALGGLMYVRHRSRILTLQLDDGVMVCGFKGDPAVLPESSSEITFHETELRLRAAGRVVFSGPVDEVYCWRSDESRWGFLGADCIQVVFPEEQLDATAARWHRIYQQFGAGPQDLQVLDQWIKKATQDDQIGRAGRNVWLQHSFLIPGTNIGIYTQSIPVSSDASLNYDARFSIFWEKPR
jgi:hypothetical protein